jgi:ribonucleoside-diphosphate reductase alpha chain
MQLKKRNGNLEKVDFSKIQKRLEELSAGLDVDLDSISQKAIGTLYDGVSTRIVDEHLATISVNHSVHPDYNTLAGRICASSLHKETSLNHFTRAHEEKLAKLLSSKTPVKEDNQLLVKFYNALFEDNKRAKKISEHVSGKKIMSKEEIAQSVKVPRFYYAIKLMYNEGVINDEVMSFVEKNREKIENYISYKRDFLFDYFGFKTLERAYLLKKHYEVKEIQDFQLKDDAGEPTGEIEKREVTVNKFTIVERPQDMFMRVAIGILRREEDKALEKVFEMYDSMSEHYYTHATPTLFNSGTKREQNSSCFLLLNEGDSIEEIFNTYKEEALISKNSGGIGVAISNIRAKGSIIKGTNGTSKGILPFLKILNEVARGIDQGGKRKGSIAVYLEPWHADVEDFIRLRRNDGKDEERTRDLFLALWMPNLFYERVKEGKPWSLFSPDSAPNLMNVYGKEFEELYLKYESEGKAIKTIDAREFFKDVFENQVETGTPYILNKDFCNEKSNQKNLGTIKSSNLCTEIVEFTSEKESAVCNLASVCLPKFVVDGVFDHEALHAMIRRVTYNLNAVIDVNFYVNEKTRISNMRHRPIGIGVQGLADVFNMLRLPYCSKEAQKLNEDIFETIYHASVSESLSMAKKNGHYPSMKENGGAPITKGILQFDMWNKTPESGRYDVSNSKKLSWTDLREEVKLHGLRNSLLVAPMPTASTSQIFNNYESFEAITENLYKRNTLSGEFLVANKHLIRHLEELGLWGSEVRDHLVSKNGSIQGLTFIPKEVRDIYKTVWELKLKPQIDMAADRGAYICQSQSLNFHLETPSMELMKNYYMYAYEKGLKTASYYFKTTAVGKNQAVTLSSTSAKKMDDQEEDDDCLVCGS